MASADFSAPVAARRRTPARDRPREAEISLGKTLILPPVAAGFTNAVSERLSGLTIRGWLTPPHRPSIRFLFVRSGVCRRLPPHPASRRRSCPWLAIPVVTARRGLPPPTSAPCQAHLERKGGFGRPFCFDARLLFPRDGSRVLALTASTAQPRSGLPANVVVDSRSFCGGVAEWLKATVC